MFIANRRNIVLFVYTVFNVKKASSKNKVYSHLPRGRPAAML